MATNSKATEKQAIAEEAIVASFDPAALMLAGMTLREQGRATATRKPRGSSAEGLPIECSEATLATMKAWQWDELPTVDPAKEGIARGGHDARPSRERKEFRTKGRTACFWNGFHQGVVNGAMTVDNAVALIGYFNEHGGEENKAPDSKSLSGLLTTYSQLFNVRAIVWKDGRITCDKEAPGKKGSTTYV